MINALLIVFLLLSIIILKCGFEMYTYLMNKGHINSTNSWQEQLAFIPNYINLTTQEEGKVGKWFKIFVAALLLQGFIFFMLIFVLES